MIKISLLNYIILLLSFATGSITLFAKCDDAKTKLPSIWSHVGPERSYQLMYDLHLESSVQKITVEEWANFDRKQFRIDLIYAEDRITYLTNAITGEIFKYEPYNCYLIEPNSKELGILKDLFQGFVMDDSKVMAYGVGPLWLRAMSSDSVVKDAIDYSQPIDKEHKSYLVTFSNNSNSTNKVTYNLKFEFPNDEIFFDKIEWITPGRPSSPIAVLRIIMTQFFPISNHIFDIPAGYGCQRSSKFDHPLKENLGSKLLDDLIPNQAILQVSVSQPQDELLRIWESEKYTVRLMKGALKLNGISNSYWVTMIHSRDPETSRFKKSRLVWRAEGDAKQAVVYRIDDTLGTCQSKHQKIDDHIRLTFPTSSKNRGGIEMSIGTDLISYLMDDHSGYHFIREQTDPERSMFRDIIYERRINNFRELDDEGNQVWTGPVSIIKEITYQQLTTDDELLKIYPILAKKYHQVVTVLFFDEDKTKILYKAVIDLLEQSMIDVTAMHKEMDISRCIDNLKKEEVVIKYPMESVAIARKLEAVQNLLKNLFTINLFSTTSIQPLQVSNIAMEFDNFYMYVKLTLLDLPLTQTFNMKKDMRLIVNKSSDKSIQAVVERVASDAERCASSCDRYHCNRFSYDPITQNCRIEVIDGESKTENSPGYEYYEYEDINILSLWSKYEEQIGARSHLRPHQIVDMLSELIGYNSYQQDSNDQQNPTLDETSVTSKQVVPLLMRVPNTILPGYKLDDPGFVELKPSSVKSDCDSMSEFMKQEIISENGTKIAIRFNAETNLKVQYELFYSDRIFDSLYENYESLSYDQCEKLCEENNCRSFSYCNYNSNCRISNSLHATSDIVSHSRHDDRCNIFVLDFLSKFEDLGRAKSPTKAKKSLVGISKRDCANACMIESGFSCQGFYHCVDQKKDSSTSVCLMNNIHVDEAGLSQIYKSTSSEEQNQTVFKNQFEVKRQCQLFSRSFLAHFDEYHRKRLKSTSESDLETVEGVGTESCARLCVEKSCLAFDMCLNENGKEICQLEHNELRKSSFEPARRCTSFVLSDKSEFNRNGLVFIRESPDKIAEVDKINDASDVVVDEDELKASENDIFYKLFNTFSSDPSKSLLITKSHWLSRLMSLLFGLIIGIGCAFLWQSQDNLYILGSRIHDRFRRR